jgi:hypothetical protein
MVTEYRIGNYVEKNGCCLVLGHCLVVFLGKMMLVYVPRCFQNGSESFFYIQPGYLEVTVQEKLRSGS